MKSKIELFNHEGESRGFYSLKNRLNELTGKEWLYWSKSVINKQYPPNTQHKLRSKHGGQKPPELCADIIKIFTKRNQEVLDPFAGVGGTLLGASLCGRRAVGIEISKDYVDIYNTVCEQENLEKQTMVCSDSRHFLPELKRQNRCFDFLLTDVPYWSMDKMEKSKGKYKKVGEIQREKKKSKLSSFNHIRYNTKGEWEGQLKEIFALSIPLLKEKSYMAVFIGDMYNNGRLHFLSADLARILEDFKLTPKANLIWYDVSKSLHIYGYQYEYIPSMIHQNVLIFRKEF
jgi:DNA modification methylase